MPAICHHMKFWMLLLASSSIPCNITTAAVIPDPVPSEPIPYMRDSIPEVSQPEYRGQYYERLAPATFDLAERSALAINALTESLNPKADMEGYWVVDLLVEPPRMAMQFPGVNARSKFSQILPVCRTVSGTQQNIDREHRIREVLLLLQGDDGLVYTPLTGRPWGQISGSAPASGIHEKPTREFMAGLTYDSGWILGAFSLYHLQDPDGPWLEAAKKLASVLKSTVIDNGETAYVFQNSVQPGYVIRKPETPPVRGAAMAGGQLACGLAQHHRLLGIDPEAAQLAAKILRHVMRYAEYFGPNGEYLNATDNPDSGIHFHSHSRLGWVALEVARTLGGDEELEEWAHRIYRYGKTTDAGSIDLIGFFPEFCNRRTTEYFDKMYGGLNFEAETCEVVDMTMNAIYLSQLGHDYWDDADRWIRNQFAENQLTWIDWVTDGHWNHRKPRAENIDDRMKEDYKWATTDRVAERNLGGFAGWGPINDWHSEHIALGIQGCCTGSGARLLYIIWKNMLEYGDGKLKLHLLFNRASKWADIDSHIPFKGQVDIHARKKTDLSVRIPHWVDLDEVTLLVNGKPRETVFDGRYLQIGKVKKGRVASVNFPIRERTEKLSLHGKDYTLVIRGSSVVSINPPGNYCPTYLRGHYRTGETLWKNVARFIPDNELAW